MKLHDSQTANLALTKKTQFYYPMKLHDSQTFVNEKHDKVFVLLPYEITRLSNSVGRIRDRVRVLLPYEITRLSNGFCYGKSRDLFYYPMKLHDSQTHAVIVCPFISFITL